VGKGSAIASNASLQYLRINRRAIFGILVAGPPVDLAPGGWARLALAAFCGLLQGGVSAKVKRSLLLTWKNSVARLAFRYSLSASFHGRSKH
jgi:hypothetical protein